MLEVLFQYGPITIRTFNIFLAFAFLFSSVFLIRLINKKKMNIAFFAKNYLYLIIMGIVGGRVLYILENLPLFKYNPIKALFIWDLHFSLFGILYSMLIATWYFTRKQSEDFWAWIDAFLLTILVALLFIHTGEFFDGINFGKPTDLPWGIAFDTQKIPFAIPIHPTQLYSLLLTFITLIVSIKYIKRTHITGVAGPLALMLYCIGEIGIDFLHNIPLMYNKVNFGIIAIISFIIYMHRIHMKHIDVN